MGNYGWCQSCGALVFGSSQCHKCDGKVKTFCVDMQLVKFQKQIKELEQEVRLLRIVIAEALEECIGDDIEKATERLEQLPERK